MFKLLLIAHLLIQNDQFALNGTPLGQLSVELVLNLDGLDLLNLRRVLLQLLRHFLEDLALLLQL